MTARTTIDSCPFVYVDDILEDQDLMASVVLEDREPLAVAIIEELCARGDDSLAAWINEDDQKSPLTNLYDGSDAEGNNTTISKENVVYIWQKYIETGHADIRSVPHALARQLSVQIDEPQNRDLQRKQEGTGRPRP